MSKWILQNLTPDQLEIRSMNGVTLQLAPFERRELEENEYNKYPIDKLESQGLVSDAIVEEEAAEIRFANVLSLAFSVGFVVVIFLSIISEDNPEFARTLGYGTVIVGVLLFSLLLFLFWKGRAVLLGWLRQVLSLALILSIGAGLPFYVYYRICGIGDTPSQ